MTKSIFVNLPVSNLDAAMTFYEALGFENNPQFTDETVACMVWSDAISVMLLTHEKWRQFTDRRLPESDVSEVMLALSLDSRDAVDAMNAAAASHGGRTDISLVQDYGWMYSKSLSDPDGHIWEPCWMDLEAFLAAKEAS